MISVVLWERSPANRHGIGITARPNPPLPPQEHGRGQHSLLRLVLPRRILQQGQPFINYESWSLHFTSFHRSSPATRAFLLIFASSLEAAGNILDMDTELVNTIKLELQVAATAANPRATQTPRYSSTPHAPPKTKKTSRVKSGCRTCK